MQVRLNNRYMDTEKREYNDYNEFTVQFIDSDLPFLMNWFYRIYDPITGRSGRKIDYVEDVYFIKSNFMHNGKFINSYIKEIDLESKTFILSFDAYVKYDPISERNKKLNKIIKRIL